MEIAGKFHREEGGWRYACPFFEGFGPTPNDAYTDYLRKFDHRGPPLPMAQGLLEKSNATTD